MIFEIIKFGKFLEISKLEIVRISSNCKFSDFSQLPIFGIFQIANFRISPNCKFSGFFKIEIFWNRPNWKIIKFLDFVQFGKLKFGSKNWQFWNCSCIPHYLQFCQFSYLPFDMNKFSQFLLPHWGSYVFVKKNRDINVRVLRMV